MKNKVFRKIFSLFFLFVLAAFFCGCKNVFWPYNDGNSKHEAVVTAEDLKIDGKGFAKTSFVTVIPKGKTAVIPDKNCPVTDWDNYKDNAFSDVFNSRRTVTLNNFEMSRYEVTQELYEAVMGKEVPFF